MKENVVEPVDHPMAQRSAAALGAARSRYAQWLIAFFLGVIAACLLLRSDGPLGSIALAQSTAVAGARGVFAFTGQIGKDAFGVFMVDVDQGTMWCYEVTERRGTKNLNLVAGRSWRFDRYLEKFNDGDLSMEEVEGLVEKRRNERLKGAASPAVNPVADPQEAP